MLLQAEPLQLVWQSLLLQTMCSAEYVLVSDNLKLHIAGARMNVLLPAVIIRAAPPNKVDEARVLVAGLICILGALLYTSYARGRCLRRVELALLPA